MSSLVYITVDVPKAVQGTVELIDVGLEEHEVTSFELTSGDTEYDDQRPNKETNSLSKKKHSVRAKNHQNET